MIMNWSNGENHRSAIRKEIYGVFFAAAALLLSLAFYAPQKWTGPIGSFTRGMGLGILGTAAYIIPAFLVYLSVEYFLSDELKMTRIRLICIGLILLTLSGIVSLVLAIYPISEIAENNLSATQLIGKLWNHGSGLGDGTTTGIWSGGLIGGLIGLGLQTIAGKTGAMIILIAMTLAFAVLIFNVSYTAYVRKSARVLKDTQARVGSSIRTKIQDRRERGVADRQYDELGDRYWLDPGSVDSINTSYDGLDYPDNLRRTAGHEPALGPDSTDQVKYYLPQGDLRENAGDYDHAI